MLSWVEHEKSFITLEPNLKTPTVENQNEWNGSCREKTYLRGFAKNTDADQPAQSDQGPCYSLFGKYHMYTHYRWNLNFLASLNS